MKDQLFFLISLLRIYLEEFYLLRNGRIYSYMENLVPTMIILYFLKKAAVKETTGYFA